MGLATDLLLHMGLVTVLLLYMGLATVLLLYMGLATSLLFHMGLYLLSGLLSHMGLDLAFFYTWALTRLLLLLVPQSWLPSQPRWHYKSSDTDAPEHSQRHSPFSVLQTFSISCGGDRIPIKVCASDDSALLLRPWSTLQSSSFLPSVSHAGEFYLSRFTHLVLRLCYFDLGVLCSPHPFCLQYLMWGKVLPIKVLLVESSLSDSPLSPFFL